MSDATKSAALRVAQMLRALEGSINESALLGAKLPAILLEELTAIGLSPIEGQRALDSAAETFSMLVQARNRIGNTHRRLNELAQAQGVEPASYGDLFTCEAGPAANPSAEAPVRLVA